MFLVLFDFWVVNEIIENIGIYKLNNICVKINRNYKYKVINYVYKRRVSVKKFFKRFFFIFDMFFKKIIV